MVPPLKVPGHERQYADAVSGLEDGRQYAGPADRFGL